MSEKICFFFLHFFALIVTAVTDDDAVHGTIVWAPYRAAVWSRAKVTAIQNGQCMLKYIDIGDEKCIAAETIRKCPENLVNFESQASLCHLLHLEQLPDSITLDKVREFFKKRCDPKTPCTLLVL